MSEKTLDEQLEEARARKAKHDAALETKAKADELEFLRLEEKFETELGGRHGAKFAIVNLCDIDEGFVVLALGDGAAALHKAFETRLAKLKDGQKLNEEALDQYVTPSVKHPPVEAFRALCGRRYAVWTRCTSALLRLHGVRKADEEGKF